MKKISIILLFLLIQEFFQSCNISGTSWDLEGIAPVIETTIDLSKAIGDDKLAYQPDSAVYLNFYDTVYTFNYDSLIKIPDTSYVYSFNWPLPNFTIPVGLPLPPFPVKLKFGLGNRIKLTNVQLESGKLIIKIRSVIPIKVIANFSSPYAILNGNSIYFNENIDAALSGDTIILQKVIDLSGYSIDLRGINQNEYNVFYFYVTLTINPESMPLAVTANQFLFSIENKLFKIKPSFAQGHVNSSIETINTNFLKTGISKFIKGGLLDIDSVRLGVKLINTLGVDLRVRFDQIRSINDLTGVQKYLIHPIIGNYVNLQMAQNTNNPINPVQHYDYTIWFTPQNSNIDQLIENLPDRFRMNAVLEVNPLNIYNANNNFLYVKYPPKIAVTIKAPIKFSVHQLYFVDTLNNPVFDEIQLDRFLSGIFTIKAENKFPIGFSIQAFTLNDAGLPVDSLFADNDVLPAPVNANYRVEQPIVSYLNIPFDQFKAQSIKSSKKILITAKFTSVPDLQLLQMYSDYYLKLKLLADIKYRVVL